MAKTPISCEANTWTTITDGTSDKVSIFHNSGRCCAVISQQSDSPSDDWTYDDTHITTTTQQGDTAYFDNCTSESLHVYVTQDCMISVTNAG